MLVVGELVGPKEGISEGAPDGPALTDGALLTDGLLDGIPLTDGAELSEGARDGLVD